MSSTVPQARAAQELFFPWFVAGRVLLCTPLPVVRFRRSIQYRMAAALMPERLRPKMAFGEIISFAYDTFCSNKVRFILTALGMVIGTASLILVVTIGMTGRQYVLNQKIAIGTNEVWAEYLGGAPH